MVRFLQRRLTADGFETLVATGGARALELVESELPGLIILDISMPEMDGFEVCRRIREWSQVPIIFLSARGEEENKVQGLKIGGDDYLCKPFGSAELKARIDAILRRIGSPNAVVTGAPFVSGKLKISFAERRVKIGDEEIKLTRIEYNLLQELVLNAGKVLTHHYLLNRIWGPEYSGETEYLRVFVNRVRRKLKKDSTRSWDIVTLTGVGYQFVKGAAA